jgi:hypothetical protein
MFFLFPLLTKEGYSSPRRGAVGEVVFKDISYSLTLVMNLEARAVM